VLNKLALQAVIWQFVLRSPTISLIVATPDIVQTHTTVQCR